MNKFLIRVARQNDTTQIAQVHVTSWNETYSGLLPDTCLQTSTVAKRQQQWADYWKNHAPDQFLWVAENMSGDVIGFMCGGPERTRHPRFDGELYALYVLQAWQYAGVGRQLWRQCLTLLAEHGAQNVVVWVLSHNPARGFYCTMGGQLVLGRTLELGGSSVAEVGYGWRLESVTQFV